MKVTMLPMRVREKMNALADYRKYARMKLKIEEPPKNMTILKSCDFMDVKSRNTLLRMGVQYAWQLEGLKIKDILYETKCGDMTSKNIVMYAKQHFSIDIL